MKNKWFGICSICGKEEEQLETNKVSTECGVNYTVIRSCSSCFIVIREAMDSLLDGMSYRKDQKK